jgi:S1-C subfamily serine protease
MVVLVGAGHVAYGVGIERQARHWFDGRIASIVPVPVRDPRGQPVASVRASYANFVWGVAAETDPPFPALGLSTRAAGGGGGLREVILVEKDSVGARSGFERGDVLVAMDGVALPDRETFNRLMAGVSWGDAVTFLVRRGAEERMLTAHFRRRHQGAP